MMLCECGCGQVTSTARKTSAAKGHVKGQPLRFVNGHNARTRVGESHPHWLGSKAGYMAIHNWVRRHKAKSSCCEECGARGKTDWANISGQYRRDLDDYRELCRSCHLREHRSTKVAA